MSAINVLQGFLSFLIARTPFVAFVVLSSLSAGTPPPGSTGPSVANSIPRIMVSPAEDLEEDYVVINITPSNDFLSPYLCPDRVSLRERRAPKSVVIPSNTNGAAKRCSIAYRANTPETIRSVSLLRLNCPMLIFAYRLAFPHPLLRLVREVLKALSPTTTQTRRTLRRSQRRSSHSMPISLSRPCSFPLVQTLKMMSSATVTGVGMMIMNRLAMLSNASLKYPSSKSTDIFKKMQQASTR